MRPGKIEKLERLRFHPAQIVDELRRRVWLAIFFSKTIEASEFLDDEKLLRRHPARDNSRLSCLAARRRPIFEKAQ